MIILWARFPYKYNFRLRGVTENKWARVQCATNGFNTTNMARPNIFRWLYTIFGLSLMNQSKTHVVLRFTPFLFSRASWYIGKNELDEKLQSIEWLTDSLKVLFLQQLDEGKKYMNGVTE